MKIRYIVACLVSIVTFSVSIQPVATAQSTNSGSSCSGQSFLGIPAWYDGLLDSNCTDIRNPATYPGEFPAFVGRILLNIVEIILRIVGYVAVAFIIYGGYKYMISAGSTEGMMAAKKTIMNAVIGLVISLIAVAIVNTVANSFGQGEPAVAPECSGQGPC